METESGTVESRKGEVDGSKPDASSGNGGNSGNEEEPKPETNNPESEKSEPPAVETVETENPPEIKLTASSSSAQEAGEDSEMPAEEESETEEAEETEEVLIPYDISLLHQILSFLIQLADPTKCVCASGMTDSVHVASLNYGLSMINTLLEMYGDLLASHPSLISLLQGVFCKYLIQNSRAEDTQTLSLTLRVIFNLFQSLKSFLKVQLEVFITSVHIRLADTSRSRGSLTSREPQTAHDFLPKEVSLESLLDFCQEPTVMIDLYTNVASDARADA